MCRRRVVSAQALVAFRVNGTAPPPEFATATTAASHWLSCARIDLATKTGTMIDRHTLH